MTIIAIDGIPPNVSYPQITKIILKLIAVKFQGLNFAPSQKGSKVYFLSIPDNVDANICLKAINGKTLGSQKLRAFIPSKPQRFKLLKETPEQRNMALKTPKNMPPSKMIYLTAQNVLFEMHMKYLGLIDVHKKSGRRLYHELHTNIEKRLNEIAKKPANMESNYSLSKAYRWIYPHRDDFAFINECLEKVGGIGEPLSLKLLNPRPPPYDGFVQNDIPMKLVVQASNDYANKIIEKITQYIESLDTSVSDGDQGAAARARVREQLKKVAPYIPNILRDGVKKHFNPDSTVSVVNVHGEPCLPAPQVMAHFVSKFRGKENPSSAYFNCTHVHVPNKELPNILASNGIILSGRKLIIRAFTKEMRGECVRALTESRALATKEQSAVGESGAAKESGDTTKESGVSQDLNVTVENEEEWEDWDEQA